MALVSLPMSLLVYALVIALMAGSGDQDAALHAIYARFPNDVGRVLSIWARPAYSVPAVLIAPLGYTALRIWSVVVCAAAAWLTYLVARSLRLRYAWLAIPFVLLQPVVLPLGTDAMTEPVFMLLLAGGLLALVRERETLAAVVLSLLPLARPEGPVVIAVVALWWLASGLTKRRVTSVLLLGTGVALWELTVLVVTRDWHYLLDTFPWQASSQYAPGPLLHYVNRWTHIIGVGLLPLWLVGLVVAWRDRVLRLAVIITAIVFVLHSALFAFGRFSSTGFDRYFATIVPLTALTALAGVQWLVHRAPRFAPRAVGALLLMEVTQTWVAVDASPFAWMPSATLVAARQARAFVDGHHPVLSADHFGYLFLNADRVKEGLPVGDRPAALAAIGAMPPGTVVVWDDLTGNWWFHLTVDDFRAAGYRLVWQRRVPLGTPRSARYYSAATSRWSGLYYLVAPWPAQDIAQVVLVKG